MAEKNIKARIVHKHDTAENWAKATSFIPKQGEIIVYDIDADYSYERFKIGDGVQNVNALPFYAGSWEDLSDKPFGKVEYKNYLVAETSIVLGESMGWTETYVSTTRPFSGFIEGQVYYVTFDGKVYPAEYNSDIDGLDIEVIDIEVYYGGNDEMTVCTASSDPRKGETHTFGIYTTELVTAQLDEQYISDTIARVSDIEVHNTSETAHSDIRTSINDLSSLVGDKSVSEQINTAAVSNQSDWSVNDETSPAYVNNRTHWIGDPYDITVVNEQNVVFTYQSGMGMSIAQFTLIEPISVNDQCTINWGEDVYHLTAQPYNNNNIIIGNLSLANMGDDTGEPFVIGIIKDACVMYSNDTSDTTRSISILCTKQDCHKLSREYLPDNAILPVIHGDSDGHILKVKNGTWAIDHPVGMTDSDGSGEIFNSYHGDFINEAGIYAHAEGYITKAFGQYSHTEGAGTIANSLGQHVHGTYNIEDDGEPELPDHPTRSRKKYVHIVGNGYNDQKRSNAHTLDWSGNAWFQGTVKIGGASQDDETAKELATQEYVDSVIAAIPTPDVSGQIETHNTSETAHSDIRNSISDLSALVGDQSVSEQIAAANMIYVGPNRPEDPNIKVWINTAEEGTGIVPVLPRISSITLAADGWTGSSEPYRQVVLINTVTAATKIDLQPTASQIVSLQNAETTLMIENNGGVVTCYAIGNKPTADYTIQVLLQEVAYV